MINNTFQICLEYIASKHKKLKYYLMDEDNAILINNHIYLCDITYDNGTMIINYIFHKRNEATSISNQFRCADVADCDLISKRLSKMKPKLCGTKNPFIIELLKLLNDDEYIHYNFVNNYSAIIQYYNNNPVKHMMFNVLRDRRFNEFYTVENIGTAITKFQRKQNAAKEVYYHIHGRIS